ncbi:MULTISPECIES: fimbria/pilus outer membrane usher protein [Providencia]|uniref:fimbria/pilus outer membrane usher protein n=1 Tax=Providencia TaxID=586 RepID=UPI0008392A5E|nr:fimbria/pilus outer membrane usher protein [Providencia heimbachae]MBP6120828.1 fimbrial biogenesis outer membrane usher protein [Providencia sp.]NIH23287.1 fimbrial biogenesis outer membrane usher protein [Providencia heimbachae]
MQKMQHKMTLKYTVLPSFFRFSLLSAGGILGLTPWACADDYFDPSFLTLSGETEQVDLSAFAQEGGVAEGEYTIAVFVNNQDVGQFKLHFTKSTQQAIAPELTPALLESWGVNISNVPDLKSLAADTVIHDLAGLIPQATSKLDLARLRLDISIPQIAMSPNYVRYVNPELWEDGIPALLFNYNVSAGQSRNHNQGGGTSQADNLFASVRGGANVGPWRLRSTMTHTRFEYSGQANQSKRTQHDTRFSNTYLSRDIKGLRSTVLAGEASTGGEIFDSVSFKGVKLTSNEQMLPSQLRGYAPAISGVANTNARITVRQNGNVVYETYVAPGPFYINDIQQAGLSGDYDVTVTEADGIERRFIVPYSALPMMLRPGGWKYELTAGRYNGALTEGSRQSDFMLGTGVYGLQSGFTVFGGALVAKDYQASTAGTGVSLGEIGAVSADVTHSVAKFKTGINQSDRKTGQSYRIRYSKSLVSTGTSVDLTALRYSTEHYYNFSEFNSQGYRLEEDINPWTLQRRRSSFQTQLSQQLGGYGSLRFRANRDDYWGNNKTLTGLSLGYSGSAKGVSFGVNYNIDRMKDTQGNWPENRQISANVSIPFRIFGYSENLQSIYATTTMTHDNKERTQSQAGLSGSALDSALSYSVSQSWGNQSQTAMSNANVGYQGSKGSLSSGYSYSDTSRALNLNASGGMLIHRDGITLSRSLGESVALVSAPGASGTQLTNGNAMVDWQGYAVAPYLSDYMKNSVGIDPTTLPEGVDVTHSNVNVYPTKGAVVRVDIVTRIGHQVLMTLKQKNQQPVPFGAIATLMNTSGADEVNGIVGDTGQLYLAGLPEEGELLVKWGETPARQCRVKFTLTDLTISPENPIRQAIYICGGESKTEIKLPAEEPNTLAIATPTLEYRPTEKTRPFSRWKNIEIGS